MYNQRGFPPFFSFLEGMVIHNIVRNRDFTHLSSEVWAAATGDTLASGDKLPSDHTSKNDVRGHCDNSSTGNVLGLELLEIFSPRAPQNLIVGFILALQNKCFKIGAFVACCIRQL